MCPVPTVLGYQFPFVEPHKAGTPCVTGGPETAETRRNNKWFGLKRNKAKQVTLSSKLYICAIFFCCLFFYSNSTQMEKSRFISCISYLFTLCLFSTHLLDNICSSTKILRNTVVSRQRSKARMCAMKGAGPELAYWWQACPLVIAAGTWGRALCPETPPEKTFFF